MDWPFLICLAALVGIAAALRDKRMVGTASVLLANWLVCTVYIAQTMPDVPTWASKYPWPVFAAFDYAAGFSILLLLRQYGPISPWQALVGFLYAVELVVHGAVGAKVIANINPEWALYRGFQYLGPIAWAQTAVVGAWGGVELARRYRMPDRRMAARHAGLGRFRQLVQNAPRARRGVTR